MSFDLVFYGVFALIVGMFIWRFFSSGSLTGALLGGRVRKEIGVVSLSGAKFLSQDLKVMALETKSGEQCIALSVVSKAPLSASVVPYKLTKPQAQELIALLQQAVSAR